MFKVTVTLGSSTRVKFGGLRCGARRKRNVFGRMLMLTEVSAPVADAPGVRRAADRLDSLLDHLVLDDQFDLHLGQEVDDIFSAPVELGVALLPPEAPNLHDRHADDADLRERFLDVVQLERLDDGFHLLHACLRACLMALR